MLSDTTHLQLTEQLFHDTITHLKRRLNGSAAKKTSGYDDAFEDDASSLTDESRRSLHLEMSVYRLCLDAVREQRLVADGRAEESHQHARENFLRLMASAAQCEMRRDQHVLSVGFAAPSSSYRPQSEAEMFEGIRLQAEKTLEALAGI